LRQPVMGTSLAIQLPTGELIAAKSRETAGSLPPGEQEIVDLTKEAAQLLPALEEVPFVRWWMSQRWRTPDRLPVIDRAGSVRNLYLGVGYSTREALFAPAIGQLIIEWIATDERPEPLTEFSSSRFAAAP